jgi:hypothetical protein
MELGEDGIILLIPKKTVVPDKASWMRISISAHGSK